MRDIDPHWLRATFDLARRARERGDTPCGSLLVDAGGNLLQEGEDTDITQNDVTAHAELNVVREAARRFGPEVLAAATLYTSTEPCAMCAGAIYWSGVRRVVFGASLAKLHDVFGHASDGPALLVPCRDVFERGTQRVEVVGPVLEDEAVQLHGDPSTQPDRRA